MAYDAFISYSHAADGRLAPALQRGCSGWRSRGTGVRALRVFRDETGLSTNPHLWSSIDAALDESEWFVLLASPEAAASQWVNQEIAHWLETKPADRILPVLTDGSGRGTPTRRRLVGRLRCRRRCAAAFTEEPRHLDLRWAHDETDLDLRNSGFRSAVADLAAPMHGIAKDELEGEDIRQHRRARRLARGGVAGSRAPRSWSQSIAGGLAVSNASPRRAQRRQSRARSDVARARGLAGQAVARAK